MSYWPLARYAPSMLFLLVPVVMGLTGLYQLLMALPRRMLLALCWIFGLVAAAIWAIVLTNGYL